VLDKLRTVKSSPVSGKETVKALGAHGNKNGLIGSGFLVLFV